MLNSKDYGIPQNRERVFTISIRNDIAKQFTFPEPQILNIKLKDLLEKQVDGKYYLSDQKIQMINNWKCYERPLKKIYGKESVIGTLTTRSGAECGGLKLYSDNFNDITNVETNFNQDLCIRKLTPCEFWLLMGFDKESFNKAEQVNNNAQLYKQAGNSIVVNVIQAILKNLLREM